MRRKWSFFITWAAVGAVVAVQNAAMGASIPAIQARGKLIVCVKNEVSRSGFHKDPAHFQKRGFEIDLAKAIAKQLLGDATKLELKLLQKPDRIPALQRNEVDLVISMLPISEPLKQQVAFSHPYAVGGLALMTKQGAGIPNFAALRGKTVAAAKTEGHDFGPEVQTLAQEQGVAVTVESYPNDYVAAAAVANGRAQGMVSNNLNLLALIKQQPGVFELVNDRLTRTEYGVAVKKGNEDLLALVNQVIDGMKQSGQLKQLAAHWQIPYEW
jgi:aspartate/glutamate/glutamine transport system substrate-binding protein